MVECAFKMSALPTLSSDQLSRFKCQQCGNCCRQPGFVEIKAGEAERIAEYLSMDLYDFTQNECEIQGRQRLVLKKSESDACIFLKEDNMCQIHEVKPEQCQDFPYKWRTEKSFEYCSGLKELLNNA